MSFNHMKKPVCTWGVALAWKVKKMCVTGRGVTLVHNVGYRYVGEGYLVWEMDYKCIKERRINLV